MACSRSSTGLQPQQHWPVRKYADCERHYVCHYSAVLPAQSSLSVLLCEEAYAYQWASWASHLHW